MGHIIDLVPNHMGISKSANPWWQDVFENGPSSRYASVFDIDWHPLKPELEHKVFLPILGDSYGAVLERQEIALAYHDGAFTAQYGIYNSLAQVAVEIGATGVPGLYQGTELWDFSLVDPNNRVPVDYDRRRTLLSEFDAEMRNNAAPSRRA